MQFPSGLQQICLLSALSAVLCLGFLGCADDEEEGLTIPHFTGCAANSTFCVENAVALCDADGLDYSLTIVCEGNQYCASGACFIGTPPITTEGGNPEGGNPEGGDPEGGDPEGGDPEGGDPNPNIPVEASCLDGQYAETPPNTSADISSDVSNYSSGNATAFIQSVLGKRFPLGLSILNGGLQSDLFDGPNCVDQFLSNKSSAQAVVQQLSTLVHECGHYYDLDIGGFFDNGYFVNDSLTILCQGGGGPSNGGQTFARSLIKNDGYAALHTPCQNWNDNNCEDTYAGIYLNGDPNDGNFDSGDQGFDMLFEETLQYVNSLATNYAFVDAVGGSVSARDGILTFLWYVERYLRMARLDYPGAYNLLSNDACWREAILQVWGRAWLYLGWTTDFFQLGIDDVKLMGLVMDPDLLNEIDLLRVKQGCP